MVQAFRIANAVAFESLVDCHINPANGIHYFLDAGHVHGNIVIDRDVQHFLNRVDGHLRAAVPISMRDFIVGVLSN